jgi:AcrR family transcriptional regulator
MNQNSKSTNPVKQPLQRRSAKTQRKILEVVEKHLLDGTFQQTSVQVLVREAGSSVGAFYGLFANKAAALYHFYDARCTDLEQQTLAMLDTERTEPLADLLSEFTEMVVQRTFGHAAIIKSDAMRLAADPDSPFAHRARKLNTCLLAALQSLLVDRQTEMIHRASHETALFVLALIGGLSRDAVLNGARLVENRGNLDSGRFVRELTRAVLGYLGESRGGKSREKPKSRDTHIP